MLRKALDFVAKLAKDNSSAVSEAAGTAKNGSHLALEIQQLRARLEQSTLSKLETIYSLQAQRDRWRSMYHAQAAAHVTAQGMLAKELEATREVCRKAIIQLNEMRKDKGLEPVTEPKHLTGDSHMEIVRQYAEEIKRLHDGIPVMTELPAPAEALREAAEELGIVLPSMDQYG